MTPWRHLALVGAVVSGLATAGTLPPDGRSASRLDALPGTTLAEHSADLGAGFREVARSEVNGPGSFEGVGHFVFVYFHDEKICQCSRTEMVISPDGRLALYTDVMTGKLMLFRAGSAKRAQLTQEFVGYPTSAVWDVPGQKADVTLVLGAKQSMSVRLVSPDGL